MRALMTGLASALVWGACAHAQPTPAPSEAPRGADGLAADELYMEADLLTYDDRAKLSTATGDVEVRYQGRTLRAQEVVYDENTGVVTARGKTQVINADGTAEFADEIILDDEFRSGVATGFSARLQQNVKLAAASAVRRSETVQELNRAIYTPCDVCADGKRQPTWSIRADKIVQDRKRQVVFYRNAVIQVFGAPVLYLPVFWHTDPQAGRSSGLLPPKLSASDRRGASYEQPYLWVISPYSDLTVSPQINAKVNPLLNARYRKRFYSGMVDARFGYTHEQDFDGKGRKFGDDASRSYILASGAFQPDEKWVWGFTAERTSDDLLFDKYEIGDVYLSRGPFIADDRRLISQVYAMRQDVNSYFSAAAFSIQGLRPSDVDRTFPTVGPLVSARWEPMTQVGGGRLRVRASAVALTRDQSPLNLAARLPGLDSRRATGELDWRASWTGAAGLRVDPFVMGRVDAYSLADMPGPGRTSQQLSRGLAVAGADVSWPFFRRVGASTVVLEPLVQAVVSPEAKNIVVGRDTAGQPIYLDEDSLAFEFDETNLFRANKFPGFDLYEDGARVNVGGRASVLWDDGRRASVVVGRTFRADSEEVFSARTGLRGRNSDWVVAAEAQPFYGLSLFGRARLDSDTFDVRRAELGANAAVRQGSGFIRYLRDDIDVNGARRENLDVGGEIPLGKSWGLTAYGNRDIIQKAWVIRDIGVFYRDECTRVDVVYRREDTVIGRLGPADSIAVRLTLATLGEPIYAN